MVTRVRDRRGRRIDARIRAQRFEFGGESDWVHVVLDRLPPIVALIGRACVDVREDAANDLSIIGDRQLCRGAHGASITLFASSVNSFVRYGNLTPMPQPSFYLGA